MKSKTIIIRSAAEAAALLTRLITIGFEKPIQVVFGNVTKKRTLSENSTYWMWISEIARETENHKEHVHEFYKDEFCPEKEITIGDCTKLVKSTKLLDKGEMYDYMSCVAAHAATELHVFVKYPDDFHREQAAQKINISFQQWQKYENGFKGMDRCNKCGATGSRFKVGDQYFPNTMAGYNNASMALSMKATVRKADD